MLILSINKSFNIWRKIANDLESIHESKSEAGKSLELFNNFEQIWKDVIWSYFKSDSENEILLIVGSQAGFTDARIISIWINSLVLFWPKKDIKIAKYLEYSLDLDSQNYIKNNIDKILDRIIWANNLDSLIYTREPSLGKKL